jgi:RHS repeat-associated protein
MTHSSAITMPEGDSTASYSCVYENEHYCRFSSRRNASKTVVGLADSSGNVTQKMVYSAWGQPGYETSSGNLAKGSVFEFGYTGMFVEPYTGLLHTHFRDYDWKTHRWDREDPAGYVDGLNLYGAYFDVNGVDATDTKNDTLFKLDVTPSQLK